MRRAILCTAFCLLSVGCNTQESFNRGYVISKAQIEPEAPPASVEPEAHTE